MKKVIAALGAVALALGLVAFQSGCGSSSSPPPTKAAYLKQVNKICQDGEVKHDRLFYAATEKLQSQGETSKLKEKMALEFLSPFEETTQQLADLTPPEGGEPKVEALVKAREKAAKRVAEDPLSIYEGHPYRKAESLARTMNQLGCLV